MSTPRVLSLWTFRTLCTLKNAAILFWFVYQNVCISSKISKWFYLYIYIFVYITFEKLSLILLLSLWLSFLTLPILIVLSITDFITINVAMYQLNKWYQFSHKLTTSNSWYVSVLVLRGSLKFERLHGNKYAKKFSSKKLYDAFL